MESELDRARKMINSGDSDGAIELLYEILDKEPGKKEYIYLLLAEQYDYKEIKLSYLEKALEINPKNENSLNSIKKLLSSSSYTKYFEVNVIGKIEFHPGYFFDRKEEIEISLDQFYERYESAITKKSDIELMRVYSLSGHLGGHGYFLADETHYYFRKGKLHIEKGGMNT